MPFIHNITLPSGSVYNLEGTLYTIKGTQASSTASWTGTCDLVALKDKVTIGFIMPYNTPSGSTPTLNLTLKDGTTTTGAKTVVGADHAKAKDVLILTYVDADSKWYAIGSFPYEVVTSISNASTNDQIPTAKAVYDAIDALPEPMVFKGTVGDAAQTPTILWSNLPAAAASNQGDTYKVITAHATAPICIIGDVITSNGSEWVVIPSGDDPGTTDTWRNILVNGTEILGSAINTGGVDFVDGTNTQVSFNSTGNKISISVPETKTYLSASASGTAINAPTSKALTGLGTPSTDSFVKSYPGSTSKLTTTTITGVSGSTTASKATAGTAVSVAKAGTAATVASGSLGTETSTRTADTPMWGASVTNETLSFTFKPLSTTSVTPAVSNGTITPYTFADVTVPEAAANATTVATGAVAANSTGATVLVGLGTASTGSAITGITPTDSNFVTSASVSAQPSVSISSGATGDVEVVTDIGPSA